MSANVSLSHFCYTTSVDQAKLLLASSATVLITITLFLIQNMIASLGVVKSVFQSNVFVNTINPLLIASGMSELVSIYTLVATMIVYSHGSKCAFPNAMSKKPYTILNFMFVTSLICFIAGTIGLTISVTYTIAQFDQTTSVWIGCGSAFIMFTYFVLAFVTQCCFFTKHQ